MFAVLYHEIASADERHVAVIEKIVIRYGSAPSRPRKEGVSVALGRFKDKVIEMGTSPSDLLRQDLLAKSDVIHWQIAWVRVLRSNGDEQSATELASIVSEDQAHHVALLEGFSRMIELEGLAKSADAKMTAVSK